MSNDTFHSIHLSDEELITLLYIGDLAGTHGAACVACRDRLQALQTNREIVERQQLPTLDVSSEQLAIQRRSIYARLEKPVSMWSLLLRPRWISAGATALMLGGGLFVFQHQRSVVTPDDTISDVDLAQEVSRLSQSAEPPPAAPLKGLFE